jgi:hypothetical protein
MRIHRSHLIALVVGTSLLVHGAIVQDADSLDQSTRLAALAKVWGLLKYYHPLVATGTRS